MDTVLENIKKLMKDQGVNNTELASKMGISKQAVGAMLKGDQDIMLATLEKVARSLNTPVKTFFNDERKAEKSSNSMTKKIIFQIEIDETVNDNHLKMVLGKDFMNFLKK